MSLFLECVEYFKQSGFQRMITAWIEKYQSLGHLGGKIHLEHLSSQEQAALGLFLGMDLSCGYLQITYVQFLKKFQQTKFEGIDFLEVLKHLQNSPLYTHQELRHFKRHEEESFKQRIIAKYQNTKASLWLESYLYESHLVSKYMQQQELLYEQLCYVCEALNHLPIYQKQYMLLPVFSQFITKNPHYFDDDLTKELLLKGIEFCFQIPYHKRTIEHTNELLYQAGLLRDDLSNYCYICHIKPIADHLGWEGFYQKYEPWNMNLYNVMNVTSLFLSMPIYIVENPSVFRSLVSEIQKYQIEVGLICANGQINLCTYMLLDQLVESHCHLYYAGDYDPEGLLIADKLKQKYHDHLSLWCYDCQYFDDIAVFQSQLSSKRLQLLKSIQDHQLQQISQRIIDTSCCAYQEGLIDVYIHSLHELKKN